MSVDDDPKALTLFSFAMMALMPMDHHRPSVPSPHGPMPGGARSARVSSSGPPRSSRWSSRIWRLSCSRSARGHDSSSLRRHCVLVRDTRCKPYSSNGCMRALYREPRDYRCQAAANRRISTESSGEREAELSGIPENGQLCGAEVLGASTPIRRRTPSVFWRQATVRTRMVRSWWPRGEA